LAYAPSNALCTGARPIFERLGNLSALCLGLLFRGSHPIAAANHGGGRMPECLAMPISYCGRDETFRMIVSPR
jgi:hypothetical protein